MTNPFLCSALNAPFYFNQGQSIAGSSSAGSRSAVHKARKSFTRCTTRRGRIEVSKKNAVLHGEKNVAQR
jgi:hypothetical protein